MSYILGKKIGVGQICPTIPFRFFDIFFILTPFYSIWAMLGARYEFLTMRKVISGRKWYRNTNNLEKSDFFVAKFF